MGCQLILLIFLVLLPVVARASGPSQVLLAGERCTRNLKGETQYASMLHDERDQYEQQDAALVVQRDELQHQIQDLSKQIQDLSRQLNELRKKPKLAQSLTAPTPASRKQTVGTRRSYP